MQFEHAFPVGVEWAGADKKMTNKGFLEIFSNLATMHGIAVGHTTNTGNSVISWVVLNWKLEVLHRPVICDTVIARTWGQDVTKLRANRDFSVFSENGDLLARATSVWLGLDGATGKILRLTPENMAVYEPEPENKHFPDFQFPHMHRMELPVIARKEMDVIRAMVDYNGHVHNTAYIDLANEILPEDVYKKTWDNLEITYKQEIHPQDRVLLEYAEDGGKKIVFLRRGADREFCAAVVLY